jgi:hypothetical protein
MPRFLVRDVPIFHGPGALPYPGEVLVRRQ